MKPLAGAVDRTLRALGLDAGVARADAVRAWPRVAAAVLGPAQARGVRAVRVDGETLVVVVPTSAHAAEIRLRERELVAELGAAAPRSGVRRLRCAPTDTREG